MLALSGFVFFGLFSPGPNVILLTTSGARFGFGATVPHILGVALGVAVTAGVTGLGIGTLLLAVPGLTLVLKVAACLWILVMAWRLWSSDPAARAARDRPFSFVEAVLFQWVNPKVWAVAMSATAYVTDLPPMSQTALLAVTFGTINLGVCLFWVGAGSSLRFLLVDRVAWRLFMRTMAVGLALFSLLVFL